MTFTESVRTCFSKWLTWQGRASRSEFWWFRLFTMLAMVAAWVIFGSIIMATETEGGSIISGLLGLVLAVLFIFVGLTDLSVMVRRLHDTNRSGWWYWISLVPLVGAILLLVWFCSRGTVGSNEYGEDPLGGDLSETFG